MTATTLPAAARRNVSFLFSAPSEQKAKFSRGPSSDASVSNALLIKGMPVFRSGVFRDSMGFQHTWDDIHMDHMVEHFSLLASRGVLEHVPIRDRHPGFMSNDGTQSIIGYHTDLRTERRINKVDGIEYNYLLADYEILDEEAATKIERGVWRNMSAETGSWITNDEAEYWPVYQGAAYVDFSAVEGLANFQKNEGNFSFMLGDKEFSVAGETNNPTPPAAPAPPQAPVAPVAPVAPLHVFKVGDKDISDYAKVQSHIAALETENANFRTLETERAEGTRKAFVKSLCEGDAPRYLATQIPELEKFALSLNSEQFESWKTSQEAVAPVSLLGQHSAGNNAVTDSASTETDSTDEKVTLEATVTQFRLGGMTEDQIKETPSYKRLQGLTK